MANRQRGTVKWFDPEKGYGFIEPDQGEDVFLHISNVPRKDLSEGDRLEFDTTQTAKGLQAENVRVVEGQTTESRSSLPQRDSSLRVPQDTAPLLSAYRDETSNLAIRVEKAAAFENGERPEVPKDYSFSAFDSERLQRRHRAHLDAVRNRPSISFRTISASVDWRLAVGLGRASVYENGITLDATDGIPYVPGSGVKGSLRTFLINAVYRPKIDGETEDGKAEEKALQDELFCDLFGTPADEHSHYDEARRGTVTFHDAYPAPDAPLRVEADIMNPHFQDYYQNQKPPTDDMSPTIITFLTVREGRFTFAVSTRENDLSGEGLLAEETPPERRGSLLDLVDYWLRRLLTEHGLGAKTAVGYGFFTLEDGPS